MTDNIRHDPSRMTDDLDRIWVGPIPFTIAANGNVAVDVTCPACGWHGEAFHPAIRHRNPREARLRWDARKAGVNVAYGHLRVAHPHRGYRESVW